MSTLQTTATPWDSSEQRPDAQGLGLSGALLLIACYLPFLILFGRNLWRYRPHYEFFPVVLIVVAILLWTRWPADTDRSDRPRWLEYGLLAGGLLALASAVVLYSPWVAAVGALLTAGGLLLHLGGRAALRHLWTVWALLWLVIPPPLMLDDKLISGMQTLTSRASGRVLDFLGIHHLRLGNVIELPDRQLFVAEACSGVHSQLVLIACCAIFVVLARRTFLRGALLIASALVWATLVNITRVTIVAFAAGKYDVDLSSGWVHEVVGYFLVGIGVVLLISTDQFLGTLLAPISLGTSFAARSGSGRVRRTNNPVSRFWNRFIACEAMDYGATTYSDDEPLDLYSDKELDEEDDTADESDSEEQDDVDEEVPRVGIIASLASADWRVARGRQARVLVGSFCAFFVLQLAIIIAPAQEGLDIDELTLAFEETSLPEEVANWKRVRYLVEHRDRSSDEGECSQIWNYDSGGVIAHVSVDYPFVGWHELSNCYVGRGWRVESRRIQPTDRPDQDVEEYVQVELNMPNGDHGLLFFSLFDSAGRSVNPRREVRRTLTTKLAANPLLRFLGSDAATTAPDALSIQIQQFLKTRSRPSAEERERALAHFLEFRDLLRARWLDRRGG